MRVVACPIFSDNYAYLLIDDDTNTAAAIDPANPTVVLAAAEKEGVQIVAILTTHNHSDHAGGNKKLLQKLSSDDLTIPVIGGKGDNVQACTKEVSDGDVVKIGNLDVTVIYAPCHTPGHVLYLCQDVLFTGDTLFVGGCGNFNAGTPLQMHNAFQRIAALPKETKIYVGHEYTVNNLKFAATVEPDNDAITKKLEWAINARRDGKFTVPSTVADEAATNPFMRAATSAVVQAYANSTDPVQVMKVVRERKNSFRA